jgi:hypothetical protein
VGICAFLGNRGSATQFRVNLGIDFGKRAHNFLRLIFVYDLNRLFFAGSIFVTKLRFWCGHDQRLGWTRIKREAAETDNEKGGYFSHKERVLSIILAASASDFFDKIANFCSPT